MRLARPRLTVRRLMVAVAILALNFGVIREHLRPESWVDELVVLGALPMANVLVFVGLLGIRSRRARAYTIGFEAFGMLSLSSYVAWVSLSSPWTIIHYLDTIFGPIGEFVRWACPGFDVPIGYGIAIVIFLIPHALFGIAGGYLSAKLGAIVARRRLRPETDGPAGPPGLPSGH